jgi:hypothetical protein
MRENYLDFLCMKCNAHICCLYFMTSKPGILQFSSKSRHDDISPIFRGEIDSLWFYYLWWQVPFVLLNYLDIYFSFADAYLFYGLEHGICNCGWWDNYDFSTWICVVGSKYYVSQFISLILLEKTGTTAESKKSIHMDNLQKNWTSILSKNNSISILPNGPT